MEITAAIRGSRLAFVLCSFIALVVYAGMAMPKERENRMQGAHQLSDAIRLCEAFTADVRTRDMVVDSVLAERRELINSLIVLFDPAAPEKQSDEVRAAAAFLLGELRAVEAAPILARSLTDEPGPGYTTAMSRYDFSVRVALTKIGKPAVPYLAENITKSQDQTLRRDAATVLSSILGGKRRLLEFLSRLHARAEEPAQREHIEQTAKWVEEIFKDEEPRFH